jgi:hypothetical protein
MLTGFFESAVHMVDTGATKMLLRSQARKHAASVTRVTVLTADGREAGIAVSLGFKRNKDSQRKTGGSYETWNGGDAKYRG